MSPVERKKIEDVAKEAGIHEDDIPFIVDLELRMKMVQDEDLGSKIVVLVINLIL